MNRTESVKIPTYQFLQYVILVWLILKRRVFEELKPQLGKWQTRYNIAHVEVGLPQGDYASMWSDMWSEAEKAARYILNKNDANMADKLIEPSEFVEGATYQQVFNAFRCEDWSKSKYLWLKILEPYLENLIHLTKEMQVEIFREKAYELVDGEDYREKAESLIARFWTNFQDAQWEEFLLHAIVIFLDDTYQPTNRERSENSLTPVHRALFFKEAADIVRGINYLV